MALRRRYFLVRRFIFQRLGMEATSSTSVVVEKRHAALERGRHGHAIGFDQHVALEAHLGVGGQQLRENILLGHAGGRGTLEKSQWVPSSPSPSSLIEAGLACLVEDGLPGQMRGHRGDSRLRGQTVWPYNQSSDAAVGYRQAVDERRARPAGRSRGT